ncbi:MAG TPA: hypothetical protein VG497_30655 [Kribbella sp.]|nr:hypothetical protein [Kribbella sp.]
MTIHISNAARSAAANAAVDLVDAGPAGGKIRIYSGAQPAGPDTAIGAQVLLAELTMDATAAFGAAVNGVKTLDTTPVLSTSGLAAGTAAWFRMLDSNNVAVLDGSAGTSGTDLILNTTTISVGVTVEVTAGTITMPG